MNQPAFRSMWLAALLLAAVGRATAGDEGAQPAWELWPYRVAVIVAVEESLQLPPRLKRELPELLQERIGAAAGGAWKLKVTAAPAELGHSILQNVGSLTQQSLPASATGGDKVILLAIAGGDRGMLVHARELDLATGLWNAPVAVPARQAAYVPHAAARAVLTAFAPLGRIERSDRSSATLQMRAGALAPRGDKLFAGVAAFRPVLMPCDAAGVITPGQAELIGWTYLVAEQTGGRTVECRIQTGLAGDVIPAYHPLRQRWALGVSRSPDATKLRVVSSGAAADPLEGIQIVADESSPAVIGQTDRRGEILITPGSQAVRTIVVRQGEEVLARLPLVPGLEPSLTVPVSYDRRLVQLESQLAQLADELVDAAARRGVLTARMAAAEAAGQTEDVANLRSQLAAASAQSLSTRLDKLQQSLQSASAATKRRLEPKVAELRKGIEQLKPPAK